MDVRKAIASLPEFAQRVCEALGNGLSISETARQLGVRWHAVRDQVQLIRRHLERLGLEQVETWDGKEVAA